MTAPATRTLYPPRLLVVLDTETTGLPSHLPGCPVRPIAIGAAGYARDGSRWQPVGTFSRLLRPAVWAPGAADAERIHGLSRARVEAEGLPAAEGWALFAGVLRTWAQQVEGADSLHGDGPRGEAGPLVGYTAWNSAFDWPMIRRWCADAGRNPAHLRFGDVRLSPALIAPLGCLMRAWKAHTAHAATRPGGSLDKARAALSLRARSGHHDAGEDAVLAGEVLQAMAEGRGPGQAVAAGPGPVVAAGVGAGT